MSEVVNEVKQEVNSVVQEVEKLYNVVLTATQLKKIWEIVDTELKGLGVKGLESAVGWHNNLSAAQEVVSTASTTSESATTTVQTAPELPG